MSSGARTGTATTLRPKFLQQRGGVGQVVFALRVAGREPFEGVPEARQVEDVTARVDLADGRAPRANSRAARRSGGTDRPSRAKCGRTRSGRGRRRFPSKAPKSRLSAGDRANRRVARGGRGARRRRGPIAGPRYPSRTGWQAFTASPVPSCRVCEAKRTSGSPGEAVADLIGAVADDDDDRLWPPHLWRPRRRSGSWDGRRPRASTLALSEFIRLPCPAARMIATGPCIVTAPLGLGLVGSDTRLPRARRTSGVDRCSTIVCPGLPRQKEPRPGRPAVMPAGEAKGSGGGKGVRRRASKEGRSRRFRVDGPRDWTRIPDDHAAPSRRRLSQRIPTPPSTITVTITFVESSGTDEAEMR